ncbi:dTDP-4-dehydrorhamnose 3,5-epimerase family protein [Sphaerisporangium sp. NPDC049002]|uniref:dTDP-4-dehydrorhamnose 3,5-epimerase family protein n=1 Tax=Sphaerisporangium sp. NPDC049002 TaxID=3155392 RepID=UPI0033D3FA84
MKPRELAVTGAFEFVPETYPDDRGFFVSTYQEAAFAEAVGHPLFPVAQASQSTSRRGVVRGVHYTLAPPGTAKYVYCTRGRALDLVVDLRVGSPTFGRWDQLELAGDTCRSVYLPPGVGHAFAALEDDTVVCYLLSQEYQSRNELAVSVFDAEIGLILPSGAEPILSERDLLAPTLSGAAERGLLPRYEACLAVEKGFPRS